MDDATRAMLTYAVKLTETPGMVGREDVALLANAGWTESAIWEIAALTSFFNYSGRLEAASGLPQDQVPDGATLAEARVS